MSRSNGAVYKWTDGILQYYPNVTNGVYIVISTTESHTINLTKAGTQHVRE